MIRCTTALFALLVTLAATAAPAHASQSQIVTFEAPRDLLDARYRDGALAELESLGVRALRVVLYWRDVAPDKDSGTRPQFDASDPSSGYAWGEYDALLQAARERRWRVVLTVSGPVPRWATRDKRDNLTRPDPQEFGRFVEAAAKRYGDHVDVWSVWNEPNHPKFLLPQYAPGKRPLSPRIYRALYRSADAAFERTGNGSDTVLFGETAPVGTGKVVAPLTFIRSALCLNASYRRSRSCGRIDADGYAHHPYTTRTGPFYVPRSRNDVTIGVLSRLTQALDRAGRAGALPRRLPLWLTEFGVQSTPDRFLGVSLTKQQEYRAIAERLAWGNPRVRSFSQYLLRDSEPVDGAVGAARYPGFESGLRFSTGRAKPSLDAFRLPLAAMRRGNRVTLWGFVRPATGVTRATVQVQDRGSRARTLRTVSTNARGYFTLRSSYRAGRRWRLRWGDNEGQLVRAYRRP